MAEWYFLFWKKQPAFPIFVLKINSRALQKESNEEEKQRKIEQQQLEKEAAEYREMQQKRKKAMA